MLVAAGLATTVPALAGPVASAATVAATQVTAQPVATSPSPGADIALCIPNAGTTYKETVPAGAGSVQLLAWGGSGQSQPGGTGGRGAAVSALVPVTPGQVLDLEPGCAGTGTTGVVQAGQSYGQQPGTGFSNGGYGGLGTLQNTDYSLGGNGGGASGVQVDGGSVLLVAGGGGAVGGPGNVRLDGGDGGCGGQAGCNGGAATGTKPYAAGGAGGGASGPTGGTGGSGAGSETIDGRIGGAGGGGGGGYPHGGAGGSGGVHFYSGGGGGGGGSSYVQPGAASVTVVNGGADPGDGFIMFTWITAGAPAPVLSAYKCNNGAPATYTVPPATYNVTAWAFGAPGASSKGTDNGPGRGDAITGNLAVRPGDVLHLTAGCPASGTTGGAGWASGGQGDPGLSLFGGPSSGGGGGGGGASGIVDSQLYGGTVDQLVAAGGGGAGYGIASGPGGAGGWNRVTKATGQPGSSSGFFTPAAGGIAGGASGSNGAPGGGSARGTGLSGGGGGGGGYRGGGGGTSATVSTAGGGGEGTSFPGTAHITPGGGLPAGLIILVAEPYGTPAAPTGVSAVAGNQQATVSFTPPADDGGGSPILQYTVTATASNPAFDQKAAGSGGPITVTNLTAGQSYTFTVTATNAIGAGPASAPSNAVTPYRLPGAPLIQGATTTGAGQVTVSFTPSQADQNLGNPITSYTVTARQGVNVTTGPGITATGSGSPVTVPGLTDGTNYTLTVYATNGAGNGPESLPVVVNPQTVPGAPAGVTAVNATPVGATTGSADVSFSPPAGAGTQAITSYTVTSSPGGITATTGAGSTDVMVTGLTIGTSYTFTVHATNAVGNGPESDPSNAVTPSPVGTPSPPLNPGVTALNQEAYVSCLPPLDGGGSAITSYTVTAQPGDITATGTSCPILVQGLANGVAYTFTVTATNADGGTSQPSLPTSPVTPHVPSGGTPPANDNFSSAQVITGASGSVAGTNYGATLEPGELGIQDNIGGASVWYAWTPSASGTVTFDTCSANPGVDGHIEAFIGSTVSTLQPFGPGPSQDLCPAGEAGSYISFTVPAGVAIHIKFDGISYGNGPSEGPFTLEWSMQ
ncbi:MAG: fibronectin type protein [Actinomycetia bacterium]|nr:fibronectin type protein [Actinomycetes bacterium]